MKRWISLILLVALLAGMISGGAAAEVVYPSITVTFTANELLRDADYRAWAGNVIEQYYQDYCSHGKAEADVYSRYWPFKKTMQAGNNQFDGLYRGYYFASIAEREYGFDGEKASFSVIMYDSEDKEAFDAKKKQYYMLLLAETMEEKVAIKGQLNDNIDVSKLGCYVIDSKSGELVWDPNGIMGNLEEIANEECKQALMGLLSEVGQTLVDYYMEANFTVTGKDEEFFDKLMKEITKQAISGITTAAEEVCKNNMNVYLGLIQDAQDQFLANSFLRAREDVIEYLRKIYNGNERTFAMLHSDPVFLEAVKEYLELYEKAGNEDIMAAVKRWDEDNQIQSPYVMSKDELITVCIVVFLKDTLSGIVNLMVKEMEDAFKESLPPKETPKPKESSKQDDKYKYVGDTPTAIVEAAVTTIFAAFGEYVNEGVDEIVEGIKKDGFRNISVNLDFNEIMSAVGEKVYKELLSLLRTSVNEDTKQSVEAWVKKAKDKGAGATDAQKKGFWIDLYGRFFIRVLEEGYDFSQGKWKEDFREEFTSLLGGLLNDVIGALTNADGEPLKSFIVQELKDNLKGDALEKKADEAVGKIKAAGTLIKDAAEITNALVDVKRAVINDASDEKQVSYRAVNMYYAYMASKPVEADLEHTIRMLMVANPGKEIPEIVADANLVSDDELERILGSIFLQMEYDLVGMQYLYEILLIGESDKPWYKADPHFYKYLLEKAKDSSNWQNELTIETARSMQNRAAAMNSAWKALKP